MKYFKSDKKLFFIILLSIIFGLVGGIFGEIAARVYIFENAFNIPFFGEIDYSKNLNGVSSLIIRDAKKVVVEQDQKVNETATIVGSTIVGIYKKDSAKSMNIPKQPDGNGNIIYYKIDNIVGEGAIVTSDGWIMANFHPVEFDKDKTLDIKDINAEILKNYIIITKDKKIYSPDKIIIDSLSKISFWHILAADLPVSKFSSDYQINNGQSAIATNWRNWTWLTIVLNQTSIDSQDLSSSDVFIKQIVLDQTPRKEFVGSFLYNLNGEIIALIDETNKIISIESYNPVISSLLKYKLIKRPSLGVNFINLSALNSVSQKSKPKGALIIKDKDNLAVVKGSSAEKAGLKENDIILSVNNIEISAENSLNKIISQFLPGDEIGIIFLRGSQSKEIKIKLGELK
jgi:serine protease Do